MPLREAGYRRYELMTPAERLARRDGNQAHWYKLVAGMVKGKTVLDVGSGTGSGAEIMRASARLVEAIDPLPAGTKVINASIENYLSKSWDCVTAMDVIEHIEDDVTFLQSLLRVARQFVFLSTPNWNRSRCRNEFHVREYTPQEIIGLLDCLDCKFWSSHTDRIARELEGCPKVSDEYANFGVLVKIQSSG